MQRIKMRKFTETELNNIIEDYQNGMRIYLISQKYNRSSPSIINKLKSIGIFKGVTHRYTDDEKIKIAELYKKGDWEAIEKLTGNTSHSSVLTLMSDLKNKGGNKNHWSKKDELIVKDFYLIKSLDEVYDMIEHRHSKDAIQTKALRKYGYRTGIFWTEEEDYLIKTKYPYMPMKDFIKLLPNRTENAIQIRAKLLKVKSYYSYNFMWTQEEEQFVIDNWEKYSDKELAHLVNKSHQAVKEKRQQYLLYRQDKTKHDSYYDLNKYFRGNISDWKNASIKACDYQCVLTGRKDFQIHHLYSVNKMIKDMFKENPQLKKSHFSDYSDDELSELLNIFINIQNRYPLGVCVCKDLHDLFHSLYGRTTNERQWNEFCQMYKNGEFNNIA